MTASDLSGRKLAAARLRFVSDLYNRMLRVSGVGMFFESRTFGSVRREFYDRLWRRAARNTGAEFTECKYGFHRIRRDGVTTIVNLSSVMLDDHLTLNVLGHKALTHELLAAKGYDVPAHCVYTLSQMQRAEMFLLRQGGSVVVKPASATGGGHGVTTGITTTSQLRQASRYASRFDPMLLIEEQLTGASYRLLYLNGKFIDAVRRDPPLVEGDGRHTIRQLVRIENQRRCRHRPFTALSPLVIDLDCRNALEKQGLSLSTRIEAGQTIKIKQTVNDNSATQNHNVREVIHPDIIHGGAKLVIDLGVHFSGIDLICSDISIPPSEGGTIFNEINTTPGIHHHYLLAEPEKGVPVAELVLEHIFSCRQGVMFL